MTARLHRDLRDAWQAVERHEVADDEHLGMAGQRAVGPNLHAAGAINARAGGLGDEATQRRGLDAGRSDLRRRLDPVQVGIAGVCVDPSLAARKNVPDSSTSR